MSKTPRKPTIPKWERVTDKRRLQKKACDSCVSPGQLYREISKGYQHFLSTRGKRK